MLQREFWKIVLASSFISTGLVVLLTHCPSPPPTQAKFEQSSTVTFEPGLTDDESINIQIYESLSRGVVNVTSVRFEYTWFFEAIPREGIGSGVVIDKKGHLVTNYHVIEDARELAVTLYDKSKYQAEVIGADPINDIALLRIDSAEETLFPIQLGGSDTLKVGQKVLAIGNPFGLEQTLTTGIISSLERKLKTKYGVIDELIQTDAAINPGNSGGPLLNTRGEIIGINTAIYSRTGESVGIGFAVPVSTLSRIIPDLLEYGEVRRAWFGVQGRGLTPALAEALELPVQQGVLVEQVEPGSSADQAGLLGGRRRVLFKNAILLVGGDVIISLSGEAVNSLTELMAVLEDKRPGKEISIVFYRENQRIERTLQLVGLDSDQTFRF